jgi:hypothetical protein
MMDGFLTCTTLTIAYPNIFPSGCVNFWVIGLSRGLTYQA